MKSKQQFLQFGIIFFLTSLFTACRSETDLVEPTTALPNAAYTQAAETIIAQLTKPNASTVTSTSAPAELTRAPTATLPAPSSTGDTLTPTISLTPSQTFTITLPPTPTLVPGDPRGEIGIPDWQADFTGETDWYLFDEPVASIQTEEGILVLTAKSTDIFEIWSLSWPDLTNFYLEYVITTGEACLGADRYGMVVRAPDPDAGYLFGISCDGSFGLRYWDGDEFTVIEDWTQSEHIQVGPYVTNRIGFRAEGERLGLYVNGYLVQETSDARRANGKFGAFIKAINTPGFQIRISEVVYWELP